MSVITGAMLSNAKTWNAGLVPPAARPCLLIGSGCIREIQPTVTPPVSPQNKRCCECEPHHSPPISSQILLLAASAHSRAEAIQNAQHGDGQHGARTPCRLCALRPSLRPRDRPIQRDQERKDCRKSTQ